MERKSFTDMYTRQSVSDDTDNAMQVGDSYMSRLSHSMSTFLLNGKDLRANLHFKVPVYNLLYSFYDIAESTPDWKQLTSVLYIIAVVTTLMLALEVTIFSDVDYEQTYAAQMRYSYGWNHAEHLLNNQPFLPQSYSSVEAMDSTLFSDGATYLDFQTASCLGEVQSQACINTWVAAGVNTTGWNPANATPGVRGSPFYPWCDYPCFADRPYTGATDGSNFVTGNYARAWFIHKAHGDDSSKFSATDTNVAIVPTPIEDFTRLAWQSFSYLASALCITVLLIGTSSPNVFAREQENSSFGYQYRTIMRSYMYWMRWAIIMTLVLTVAGIMAFVNCLVYLVYVKWTDASIAASGDWPPLGLSRTTTYSFALTCTYVLFYFPMAVLILVLSIGHARLHSFPKDTMTNINATKLRTGNWSWRNLVPCGKSDVTASLLHKRMVHTDDINDLLEFLCGLPKTGSNDGDDGNHDDEESGGCLKACMRCGMPDDAYGPRETCCFCLRKSKGWREDKGLFLSGAGGMSSVDSEVVADALVDGGFYDVRTLFRLVLPTEFGGLGHGSMLFNIPQIQRGAVLAIIKGITRFAWSWCVEVNQDFIFDEAFVAEYNTYEGDKPQQKQWLKRKLEQMNSNKSTELKDCIEYIVIPEFLYLYMRTEVDKQDSEGAIKPFKHFLENNQYKHTQTQTTSSGTQALIDGWERMENYRFKGGDVYTMHDKTPGVVYRKHVKHWDDGSAVTPSESGRNSSAFKDVCLSAAIAWWMIRLSDHHDEHKKQAKMRIPDAILFANENMHMMRWLNVSSKFEEGVDPFTDKKYTEMKRHRLSPYHPDTFAPAFGLSTSDDLAEAREKAAKSSDVIICEGVRITQST